MSQGGTKDGVACSCRITGRDFSRQSDGHRRHLGVVGDVDCVIGNDHPPAYHSIPAIMTTASDGQEQRRKERRTIVLRRLATRMVDRVSDWVDPGTPRYRKIIPIKIRRLGNKTWLLSLGSGEPPLLGAVGGIPPGPGLTTAAGAGNAAFTPPASPPPPPPPPGSGAGRQWGSRPPSDTGRARCYQRDAARTRNPRPPPPPPRRRHRRRRRRPPPPPLWSAFTSTSIGTAGNLMARLPEWVVGRLEAVGAGGGARPPTRKAPSELGALCFF